MMHISPCVARAALLCFLAGTASGVFVRHEKLSVRAKARGHGTQQPGSGEGQAAPSAPFHYWPQARGGPSHYSRTSYGLPQEVLAQGNLTDYLAWTWQPKEGLSSFVWGTLIDGEKNIYVVSMQGIYKLNPDGKQLWERPDIQHTQMASISGNTLHGMQMHTSWMYALDIGTGQTLWSRTVATTTGEEGDMVQSHNGVVIAGVDQTSYTLGTAGTWALRAIGINASTGEELWSYQPECGLWSIMAVFPDGDTLDFMDSCGGVYRLGLYNGSQLWKYTGDPGSFTDGGLTLGPDGSIYTCSNAGMNANGRARKIDQSTGEQLWQVELEQACMNFPAVSPDGKTVVLSDGENVIDAPTKRLFGKGLNKTTIDDFYSFQADLLKHKSQRSHYGLPDVTGSIRGYDTQTGEAMWHHDAAPWYGMSFARDEERAYNWVTGQSGCPHCGPPQWGGPTIDQSGNVYIARSDGNLHVYNPQDGRDITFNIDDGVLMAGVSFAPGLMVVPTCSFVYVFRY